MINEILQYHPIMLYSLLALVALAVGSLLNVIIYRLPLMLQAEWSAQCCELLQIPTQPKPSMNLFFPRSFCPHCKNLIRAWQNIPILSYLFLKGRCYHCRTPIPFRYPFVELLSLGLSLLAAWHFGFNTTLLFALIFIWGMICLTFIDLQHQLLPDSLTLGLLWIGLIANTQHLFTSLTDAVLSAAIAYMSLWLFIQLFYLITGKIGMGNGDFKLFAALGAWFGWVQLPFILITSSFIGAIIGIAYLGLSGKNRETPIPFGPFLCLAGVVSLFAGTALMQWYWHYFLHSAHSSI